MASSGRGQGEAQGRTAGHRDPPRRWGGQYILGAVRRRRPGEFDTFLFADYSGAASPSAQRRAIALWRLDRGGRPRKVARALHAGDAARGAPRRAGRGDARRPPRPLRHRPPVVVAARPLGGGRPGRAAVALGPARARARRRRPAAPRSRARLPGAVQRLGRGRHLPLPGEGARSRVRGADHAPTGTATPSASPSGRCRARSRPRGSAARAPWPARRSSASSSCTGCWRTRAASASPSSPGRWTRSRTTERATSARDLPELLPAAPRAARRDDADARWTCLWASRADLATALDLTRAPARVRKAARLEGWILGARPAYQRGVSPDRRLDTRRRRS